jgi:hypothetical protein
MAQTRRMSGLRCRITRQEGGCSQYSIGQLAGITNTTGLTDLVEDSADQFPKEGG